MDLTSELNALLTPASTFQELAEEDFSTPPPFEEIKQLIHLENKIVLHNGVGEFPFACAEKLNPKILEDVLINFEMGNFDAFAGESFYVTQELASHYLDKMREWKEINPSGMHYLGEKKVVMRDSASGEFYAVPLLEILLREKEPIAFTELGKIIAEENLPFRISKSKIVHTGNGDLEDEVIDLYAALAERGLADSIPDNFFEANVEGFTDFSARRSAEEQNLMNYFILNSLVTRDGKYLTLEGVKLTWGNKEFKKQFKRLGVKDPRMVIPLCAMLGLSLGLVYAGATFSGFPQSPLEAELLGGELLHPEGEVQSQPTIWGEHAAWFDMGAQFDRELSDIVIKNLTSGEIERLHANGNERSNIMMRGDYIIWQERDRSILDHYAKHSINYYNILNGTTDKITAPANMSDASVFGEKLFYIDKTENSGEIFAANLINGKITQVTSDGITKSSPKVFGDFIAWYQTVMLDNRSTAPGIIVKNMKTNISTTIPLLTEGGIISNADFDIGSSYLIWMQNGEPAETVALLGHSELAATVDVFKLDLQTFVQSRVFSYGISSLWANKVKVSDDLAIWNAGKPRPFRLEDGRSNHRSGVFAYNLSSNQRGPISDDYNADFNVYGTSIVWGDDHDIYIRQMNATNWRYIDNYFNERNRNLLDLNNDLFNTSSLQNNKKPTMQNAIEQLVLPPSAGLYLGLAAGYAYYELNVFRPATQNTKWSEVRHRLAAFRHRI